MPCKALLSTGTPSTGREVLLAHIPGRWAAPPAPAMMTFRPRGRADDAYSKSRSGVRWAETMRTSWGTASSASVAAACWRVSQSEVDPMMMPTTGVGGAEGGMMGRG